MPADVRSPLVLDIRELDRRAGSEKSFARTVPAPAGLGIPSIGIDEGAPLRLEVTVDSVVEGFWVAGTVSGLATGECVRCLDPLEMPVRTEIGALFVYADSRTARTDDEADDAEEVFVLEGDLLDLEQAVRDAVVLDLPLLPHCREDCPGLLPDGTKAAGAERAAAPVDPRWAGLAPLAASTAGGPATM
jgi:uncharacterized protein